MSQVHDEYKYFRKIVGKNIRRLREEKNFTQETFAFELNSSPKYIGCIERGEKTPSLFFLFRIAKLLDSAIDYFLKI